MVLYVTDFNNTNVISTEQSHTLTLFQKISTATFLPITSTLIWLP